MLLVRDRRSRPESRPGDLAGGFVVPSRSPYDHGVLHRRLASLLVIVTAAGLFASGCSTEQSAAVRVDDRTVSRGEFEDMLELLYENDALRDVVFQGVSRDQLRVEGGPADSYSQEYASALAGLLVQFLVLDETLESEGLEVAENVRDAEISRLDQEIGGDSDSLPEGVRDRLVDGYAAVTVLQSEVDQDELNDIVNEAFARSDIAVNSRFGTWDADQFRVIPPSGPTPAPGSGNSASEAAPG